MIKSRVQIGDGSIVDTYDQYGLVYVSADTIYGPPLKPFEVTRYAEEEGEHVFMKTVSDSFSYKVQFFLQANSIQGINRKIRDFNQALYSETDGIKTFHRVNFYNDYKGVMISGVPSLIREADDFWIDPAGVQHSVAIVDWEIRVDKPSLCNFNL